MAVPRHEQRFELSFPVLVEVGGHVKRQMAVNVARSGMMFVSREPYLVGQSVSITFCLPRTDLELVAVAEVRHVAWRAGEDGDGRFRVGVQFQHFDHSDKRPPLRCLPC